MKSCRCWPTGVRSPPLWPDALADRSHTRLTAERFAGCAAADWVAAWALGQGLGEDILLAMRLCVEELVTNLVMHGLTDRPPGQCFDLAAAAEPGWARVTLIDNGTRFDISAAAEPGRQDSVEAASIGGRGIRLMRGFTEKLEWRWQDGHNHTTLVFKTS